MKKVIFSLLMAISIMLPAMAAKKTEPKAELKYGVGTDILIGQTDVMRVSIDGLAKNVRVDARFGYSSTTTTAGTTTRGMSFGAGAYYALSKYMSAGGFYDTQDTNFGGNTLLTGVLKLESKILKDISLSIEYGYQNTTFTAGNSAFGQYSAVTIRTFF